ncbi:MAG: Holliday junction branch migration protein RuvA [Planctomycetota bacterium]|nr:Holliday junction branch migration protein RuvA [Planctomycetota bacterium]
MYHHLTGRIVEKTPTLVVLDVRGIGFEIAIPVSTYERLPDAGEATLLIRRISRNEDVRLYGFLTREEREVFRLVMTVQGVGPSGALSLLSTLNPSAFRNAVTEQDLPALMRSKGIGRKTASRIATELLDKVQALPVNGETPARSTTDTATAALINLGYSSKEAEKAVWRAEKALPKGAGPEDLIRHALKSAG